MIVSDRLNSCPFAASDAKLAAVPSHVARELVRDPTAFDQPNTLTDPFSISEGAIDQLPPIFYWSKVRPGITDGFWVVTHYEDIREVYQNTDLYSNKGAVNFPSLVGESFRMIPLAIDPPEHGKYRIMLNPWFSPKAVNLLESDIRAVINELIDGFIDAGECDASFDFARIYPVRVFLDIMGFPLEMMDEFLEWEYSILHSENDPDKMKRGVASAIAYLRGFIETMKATPNEKLASNIVHGSVDRRPLTDDEIIGTIFFLWIGGLDTVAATTSLFLRRLALNPEMQETLRDDPLLIPDAIEEFLRVQPIVNSSRIAKRDHVIHGVTVRAGERVMGLNLTGNFDPAEFECAREVKFDRGSNRHFTFGGGPHRCLGSHLARKEMGVALTEFLRRVPPFHLKNGEQHPAYPNIIAVNNVPITWDTK
jgi:cytochrome P450